MKTLRDFLSLALLLPALCYGCATVPKAELTAYADAYSDTQTVTNGVLDIVAPYERAVIRFASPTTQTIAVPSPAPARGASERPAPAIPPAAAGQPNPLIDPSLIIEPGAGTGPNARPVPNPPAKRTRRTVTRTVVVEGTCPNSRFGGAEPYCYEMRDGFADIGDPPLVAAYRNLSNIVGRFNNLLLAYTDGVSGKLIEADLSSLSASATALSKAPPLNGVDEAGAAATGFGALVPQLSPLINIVGANIDRTQLRRFLLDNYKTVDDALVLMAKDSAALYADVVVGTQIYQVQVRTPQGSQTLATRRHDIRHLIANWTVLLDDTRALLRELKVAVEFPDGLETRLRNLDPSVQTRIDTSVVKKQLATLGTPILPP
jgi:hypothetical protein